MLYSHFISLDGGSIFFAPGEAKFRNQMNLIAANATINSFDRNITGAFVMNFPKPDAQLNQQLNQFMLDNQWKLSLNSGIYLSLPTIRIQAEPNFNYQDHLNNNTWWQPRNSGKVFGAS